MINRFKNRLLYSKPRLSTIFIALTVLMKLFSHSRLTLKPVLLTAALCSVVVTAVAIVPTAGMPVPSATVEQALPVPEIEPIEMTDTSFWHEGKVQSGDSIAKVLKRMSVDDPKLLSFMRSNAVAKRIISDLRPGRYLKVETDQDGLLRSLVYPMGTKSQIQVFREGKRLFAIERQQKLEKRVLLRSGTIKGSLLAATDEAGVPESIALDMVKIFDKRIDFLRDIRKGDHFSVLFEANYDQGSRYVNAGKILAVEFSTRDKTHQAIFFEDGTKEGGYYTPDFKPLNPKSAFLRSPLEFSRITSGFSRRKHPIFQEWRQHRGVDYAAPIGTRVRTTAEGVVKFAGQQGGYGNVVIVSHGNGFETLYAHMRGFGSGIKTGAKLSQGQTVGFVGMTGWTTGPHLHYEVRKHGTHVNPLDKAVVRVLSGGDIQRQRAKFMKSRESLMTGLALTKHTEVSPE